MRIADAEDPPVTVSTERRDVVAAGKIRAADASADGARTPREDSQVYFHVLPPPYGDSPTLGSRTFDGRLHRPMSVYRVLVTGGSGFIGSHLCRRLVDSGLEVHVVSRTQRNAADGIRWWTTDLTEYEATQHLLRTIRPELVFHLASFVTGSRDLGAVLPTFRNNLLTTVNLLTAACEVGRPLVVLAGSAEEPPTPMTPIRYLHLPMPLRRLPHPPTRVPSARGSVSRRSRFASPWSTDPDSRTEPSSSHT